jgi:hypothetical protein
MGPVMLLLYALMAQIDITIGNDLITTLTNLDNYKSVFQILTYYSGDTLNTLFQPAMYYKDTPFFVLLCSRTVSNRLRTSNFRS